MTTDEVRATAAELHHLHQRFATRLEVFGKVIDRLELDMLPIAFAVEVAGFAKGKAAAFGLGVGGLAAIAACQDAAGQRVESDDANALIAAKWQ